MSHFYAQPVFSNLLVRRVVQKNGGIKALCLTFNMPHRFVLLAWIAQVTGHKSGKFFHKIVKPGLRYTEHIYDNQQALMQNVQLKYAPLAMPKLYLNPDIKSLDDIKRWVSTDVFMLSDYESYDAIAYAFAV